MLKKFSVSNYRQFNQELVFDLTAGSYTFNADCTNQNQVKLALIYGKNGSGKSNLGGALFDLVQHLTDNETNLNQTDNYLNAFSPENGHAKFTFEFTFQVGKQGKKDKSVVYTYYKNRSGTLLGEQLSIDGKVVADHQIGQPLYVNLKGAENLKRDINQSQNLSAIKYIYSNTNLDQRNPTNALFIKFMDFVNHMLYFRSVFSGKNFTGYKTGQNDIEQDIIENGDLKDFEQFLKDCGQDFELVQAYQFRQNRIGIKMGEQTLPFVEVASTGTLSLAFFYYWWRSVKRGEVPLLFIDEFDCSYHFELSEAIIRKLKQLPATQVILTTHNTNLLTNDLIRPDCAFIINGKSVQSLNHLTNKELREVHNLEKLYQAGHFSHE